MLATGMLHALTLMHAALQTLDKLQAACKGLRC
jgi:hypothetical protein